MKHPRFRALCLWQYAKECIAWLTLCMFATQGPAALPEAARLTAQVEREQCNVKAALAALSIPISIKMQCLADFCWLNLAGRGSATGGSPVDRAGKARAVHCDAVPCALSG